MRYGKFYCRSCDKSWTSYRVMCYGPPHRLQITKQKCRDCDAPIGPHETVSKRLPTLVRINQLLETIVGNAEHAAQNICHQASQTRVLHGLHPLRRLPESRLRSLRYNNSFSMNYILNLKLYKGVVKVQPMYVIFNPYNFRDVNLHPGPG